MATPPISEIAAAGVLAGVAAASVPQMMLSDVAVIVVFAAGGSVLSSLHRADLLGTRKKVISALAGFIFGCALTWVGSLFIGQKLGLPLQIFLPGVALVSSMPGDRWIIWLVSPTDDVRDYVKNLIFKIAPFLEPKK